jgi:hypothetical protein
MRIAVGADGVGALVVGEEEEDGGVGLAVAAERARGPG